MGMKDTGRQDVVSEVCHRGALDRRNLGMASSAPHAIELSIHISRTTTITQSFFAHRESIQSAVFLVLFNMLTSNTYIKISLCNRLKMPIKRRLMHTTTSTSTSISTYNASHPSSNIVLCITKCSSSNSNGLITCNAPVPNFMLCPMIMLSLTPSIVSVLPRAAASNK